MIDIRNDNVKDINNIDSSDSIDIDNDNEINSFSLTKEELLAKDLAEGVYVDSMRWGPLLRCPDASLRSA